MARRLHVDLLLASEPNRARINAGGWLQSLDERSAIQVRNPALPIVAEGRERNFVWAELDRWTVISSYFSPNASLADFIQDLDNLLLFCLRCSKPLLVTGDFNAKSPAWFPGPWDRRGHAVEDFAATLGLSLLNDGITPTFTRNASRSVLDLTWASDNVAQQLAQWRVLDQDLLSDHSGILIEFISQRAAIPLADPCARWRYDPSRKDELEQALRLTFAAHDEWTGAPSDWLNERMQQACGMALPRKRGWTNRKPAYWWNSTINDLRSQCTSARRQVTRARRRGGNPDIVLQLERRWKEARADLRRSIAVSKRLCFQQLVEQLNDNLWGDAYQIVRRKVGHSHPPIPETSLRQCVRDLFPSHPALPRTVLTFDPDLVPQFSTEELQVAAKRLSVGKAPGPDGVPSEVVKAACRVGESEMRDAFNRLLYRGEFPSSWKVAKLVLIPKPQKPSPVPRGPSFRPICLLSTTGKLYEQLLHTRLLDELHRVSGISAQQYGFLSGRSTVDAINHVMRLVDDAAQGTRSRRKIPAVVLFDVRNAFNSVSWAAILQRLRHLRVAPYLQAAVRAYLSERALIVELPSGEERVQLTAGVPQGSVLGPLLWIILYDPVLRLPLPEDVEAIAFADDLALVIAARTTQLLMDRADAAIRQVTRFLESISLRLAPEKTEAIVMAGRRVLPRITFNVQGHQIEPATKVKYLGVWLDKNRTFLPHVAEASSKAIRMGEQLSTLMRNIGGPKSSRRRCYSAVLASVALYAVPAWSRALTYGTAKKMLGKVDRAAALRVISAYRTVSTAAACVLSSVKPLWIQAEERAARKNGVSKTVADAEAWARWQTAWQQEPTGAWTRRLIPDIRLWADRLHGEVNYWLTQTLTGHGAFRSFLHRIGKLASADCPTCPGQTDNAEHAIFSCAEHSTRRQRCWAQTGTLTPDTLISRMVQDRDSWDAIADYLISIMQDRQASGL